MPDLPIQHTQISPYQTSLSGLQRTREIYQENADDAHLPTCNDQDYSKFK